MKTIKTRSNQRDTYTYTDAMGKKVVLKPGDQDPISGAVLTEEMIRQLHRFDDNEVYNNVKNGKRPVEDWEKPLIEEWKENHPYEEAPTRRHISLDLIEEDEDADKGVIAKASLAMTEHEDYRIERLHEVIEMLRPDQKELYQRIVVNEENMAKVASEMNLDSSAIRHRMETIRKFIKKNF